MPQPVSYNPGTPVSGSIQENNISYVVDGQQRNYRGGFGGLSWMSEAPAENNVIFIGNSVSLGRGPANIPLFYPAYNTSQANIVYAANTLPGSPRNFTTLANAYNWAVTNNFFINNSDNPIPRIDADSMFLCLDAEQASSFPQTGTSWYDMSGANYTVTGTNNPTWNYGNGKSYWRFDGVDDYFAFASTPPIAQNTYTSTVEIWAKSINNVPTFQVMFGGGVQNTNQGYYYGFRQDNANFMYAFYANDQDGPTPRDNRVWNHYVAVYNQATGARYRYFNGELLSPSQASGVASTSAYRFAIGAYNDPSSVVQYFYNGYISKVRGYSRELTQAEIKQNYFQSNIVTDGLVFMTDANNIISYEGSGTTTYSLTGSITGTLTNGVGFSSRNGGVYDFDGTDDTIAINYNTAMDPTGGITLEAWIYPEDLTTVVYQEIFRKESGTGRQLFSFQLNGTIISFGTDTTANGYHELDIPITPSDYTNKWCHFVATYNSGYKAIYVNGQLLGSTTGVTGNLVQGNAAYFIGSTSGGSEFFNGYYASFKMYSRGLSATEIQQNYQATKDKFQGQQIVTQGLVFNLDSANKDSYPGTGTTWTDLSGNGNNCVLQNGPVFLPNQNNGVLSFDGTDDFGTAGNFFNYQAFTINLWIRPGSSQTTYADIIDNNHTGTQNWVCQQNVNNLNQYEFAVLGGSGNFSTTGLFTLTSNVWVNLTFTYDGDKVRGYNNGTLFGTGASLGSTINYVAPTFNIGRWNSGGRNWNGQYGLINAYNRALSAAEIAQNYNTQKTRFGL